MVSTERFGVGRLTAFAQRPIPYMPDNTLIFDTITQYYRYNIIVILFWVRVLVQDKRFIKRDGKLTEKHCDRFR